MAPYCTNVTQARSALLTNQFPYVLYLHRPSIPISTAIVNLHPLHPLPDQPATFSETPNCQLTLLVRTGVPTPTPLSTVPGVLPTPILQPLTALMVRFLTSVSVVLLIIPPRCSSRQRSWTPSTIVSHQPVTSCSLFACPIRQRPWPIPTRPQSFHNYRPWSKPLSAHNSSGTTPESPHKHNTAHISVSSPFAHSQLHTFCITLGYTRFVLETCWSV
jgi:hypothetical protein